MRIDSTIDLNIIHLVTFGPKQTTECSLLIAVVLVPFVLLLLLRSFLFLLLLHTDVSNFVWLSLHRHPTGRSLGRPSTTMNSTCGSL